MGTWYECHWCDAEMKGIHKPAKPGDMNYNPENEGAVAREVCWDCVEESRLYARSYSR